MSVQSCEFLPPASFASSSLGTPRTRCVFSFAPRSWRDMSTFCFALTQSRIRSTTPLLSTCLIIFSESSHVLPNLLCFVVSVSFVCESNAGFSTRQLMKIHRWFLTCAGLMSMPPRFLPFTFLSSASTTWSATCATCVPPLMVLMELTKLTCEKLPSEMPTATSQRSLQRSYMQGAAEPSAAGLRYMPVYSSKQRTGSCRPFSVTRTFLAVEPAMS
mmetsp:Transcript_53057/g.137013  ORF Transcript_53057/g.137013 Transcript_53057/m.137013 type:complete len:216 (-) Transcript_53057:631-1278(-)